MTTFWISSMVRQIINSIFQQDKQIVFSGSNQMFSLEVQNSIIQ